MTPAARSLSRSAASRHYAHRFFSSTTTPRADARLKDLGHDIDDDFAVLRDSYDVPKHPIVLAHGLMGFDELRLAGRLLPGIHYWRGITEALRAQGVEVFTTSVPAAASIEERAAQLEASIERVARGRSVNIIAHSMVRGVIFNVYDSVLRILTTLTSGLDSRYMISRRAPRVKVLSLTTIATPHRGSAYADYVIEQLGPRTLSLLTRGLSTLGLSTGALKQLTRKYMLDTFNPKTPDDPDVQYYSYGAAIDAFSWFHPASATPATSPTNVPDNLDRHPHLSIFSPFRHPHHIISEVEGPNDGMVSVESARWGTYQGTLRGVSHLDLINWSNWLRFRVAASRWFHLRSKARKEKGKADGIEGLHFNALALYLGVADMLAKEGL